MTLREDALQQWVARIGMRGPLHVWTIEQLREVAVEMGLGTNEFEDLLRAAAENRQRGETLFGHARIEDAREAFRAAADLVPSDGDAVHGLARCHYSIGMRDQDRAALEQARGHAHQVLRLDPGHGGAAQLLNAIESALTMVTQTRSSSGGRTIAVVTAIALVVIGFTTGVVLFIAPSSDAKIEVGTSASFDPMYEVGDRQLLVDFDLGPASGGLHLDVRESVLSVYSDSAWANVRGYLVNDTEDEFFEVTGQAHVHDGTGGVMGTRPVRFVESNGPALRPGDTAPFSALLQVTPSATRWVIALDVASSGPSPDKYDPEPVITPRMEVRPGAGMALVVRERHLTYSANQFNERGGWLRGELRFENSGTRDIETLRVRIDGLGPSGEVIESATRYVVSTSDPRLGAGDAVTLGVALSMPPQNNGIRIAVIDLQ
jgi:hypothetical protein